MPKLMLIMRPSDETVTAMSCIPFERVGRYKDNERAAKERAWREQTGQL